MSIRSWIHNLFARPAGRTIRKAPHRARLSLEALEDRWCPSTFTVFNTNDSGAGSLRDAITQAQSGANLGVADTIVFNNNPSLGTNFYDSTPDIITLNTGLTTGQLTLTDTATTTISGPGANLLSISGNNASRVFGIGYGASADLSGLTITGGNTGMSVSDGSDIFSGPRGGGLFNLGTATVTNCTVSGNAATFGGGVENDGTATLTNCTVSGNYAVTDGADVHYQASGGGGVVNNGTATLTNCTVSGNHATGPYGSVGGGVSNYGAATLTNCTVSGNSANVGGGVDNYGTATLTNCTVSGNSAGDGGGVVLNNGGMATLTNCTVSGNSAGRGYGGGVFASGGSATLTNCTVSGNSARFGGGVYGNINLGNTIVAGNSAGNSGPDVSGSVTSLGHNLIGDGQGANGFTDGENGDIVGVAVTDIFVTDTNGNPLLADNGGATQTMALLPGSPAINAGSNDLIPPGVTTDQRYFARIVGGVVDIGAYEANAETPSLVVTTAADVVDPTDGLTSLREAIAYANALPTADTITFGDGSALGGTNFLDATPDTITLTGGQLTLTDPATTTIIGPGANLLSIDGGGQSRVFDIEAGASAELSGLTITGGIGESGAGLLNEGTATLTNCTVSDNSAGVVGGGLLNLGGTATLTNCTFSDNSAGGSGGGGIKSSDMATLNMTNCTVTGNSANLCGAGVANYSTATLTGCTVSDNTGGGVYNFGSVSTLNMTNCTVSGNSAGQFGSGGGLLNYAGTATLTGCTVSGNSGPGVYNYYSTSTLNMTNCTVSGNSATSSGAGVLNSGIATLINCTVSGNNSVGTGSGLSNSGTATLTNTIVAGNVGGNDVFGMITGSHNLIGGNPLLGPLAENGGPTQTMALLPGSPAINAGTATGAPSTDQRGLGRVGAVDIGAFEYQSVVAVATTTAVAPSLAAPVYGQSLTFTATVTATGGTTPGGSVQFTLDGNTFGSPVPLDASGHATSCAISTLDATGHTIAATYVPATMSVFLASNSGSNFSIAKAGSTTTVTLGAGFVNGSVTYNGSAHGATASWASTGTDGQGGTLTVSYVGINGTSYASSTTAPTIAGSYQASASFVGDGNHTGSSNFADFAIAKANATVTVTGYTGGTYDGSAHVRTVTVTGVGSAVLFTTNLSGTNAGSYSQAWSLSSNSNYNPVNGTLSFAIAKASSSVSVTSTTFTFNNATQTHGAYLVSGVGTGITQTVTWSYVGDQIDAGTYIATATYAGDANHLCSSASATMTITPVAQTILGDVFILNKTASGALTVSGNAQLNVAGTLQVDSSSASAVNLSGNADINAAQTRIVGGDQVTGNAHFLHAVTTGAASVANPLAVVAGLTGTGTVAVNVSGNQTVTLNPGAYASITVSGNAHLILNPGIYVIGAGGVTVSGNATVTGGTAAAGVLLYNNGALTVSGNASVNLTAFSTGDYAGLAIFQALTDASAVTVSGNANLNLNGSFLYDANVQSIVTIGGNAQIEASMMVNELTISGNADDTAL